MRPHTAHLLGLEGLLPPLDWEHQIPCVDAPLGDGGELEEEGGHNANSLARPAYRPEELAVLFGPSTDDSPIGRHHRDLEQVIAGEAVLAR